MLAILSPISCHCVWDPNFNLSSTFGCFSTCSLVGGVCPGPTAAGPEAGARWAASAWRSLLGAAPCAQRAACAGQPPCAVVAGSSADPERQEERLDSLSCSHTHGHTVAAHPDSLAKGRQAGGASHAPKRAHNAPTLPW
jgi:hypothetical protein